MEHPQTVAQELLKNGYSLPHLKEIAEEGCCAFVFLWWIGVNPSDIEAIKVVSDAIESGVIDKDCTVHWKEFCKWMSGRDLDVGFYFIKDILAIKNKTPVLWKYNGFGHWVGVERGMITFNPLEHSVCVDKGSPVEKRDLKIKRGY